MQTNWCRELRRCIEALSLAIFVGYVLISEQRYERLMISIENCSEEIRKLESDINVLQQERIDKLESDISRINEQEIKKLESDINRLRGQEIGKLESEIIKLTTAEKEENMLIKSSLLRDIQNLRTDLETLVSNQSEKVPMVAFTALISKDVSLGHHQVVKYDKVITNIGEAYNPLTGHFTAPYDGLYTISCTLMNHPKNHVHLNIFKNGHRIGIVYGFSGQYVQSSQTLHLTLKAKDIIWTENNDVTGTTLHDGGVYNVFSAILIGMT